MGIAAVAVHDNLTFNTILLDGEGEGDRGDSLELSIRSSPNGKVHVANIELDIL